MNVTVFVTFGIALRTIGLTRRTVNVFVKSRNALETIGGMLINVNVFVKNNIVLEINGGTLKNVNVNVKTLNLVGQWECGMINSVYVEDPPIDLLNLV